MDKTVYSISGTVIHITVCTDAHKPLFANPISASQVLDSILHGPVAGEADLYAVCVMPDHIHMLLGVKDTNVVDLVGRWKSFVNHRLRDGLSCEDIWQRSFYDHVLRKEESTSDTAMYIANNPVRAGLVEDIQAYPYCLHIWMEPSDNKAGGRRDPPLQIAPSARSTLKETTCENCTA